MAGLYDFTDSRDVSHILNRLKRLENYIPRLHGGIKEPPVINPLGPPHCVMLGTEIETVDNAEYEMRQYVEENFWYIRDMEGHWLNCTANHRLYDKEGFPRQAQDFEPGDIIVHRTGNFEIAESSEIQRAATKVEVCMKRVHLFWANGFLSHTQA